MQTAEDGTVGIPAWGREVAVDFDANRFPPRQVILWQASSGLWRVDVREYCELDPDCADEEDEIKDWMAAQITRTLGGGAAPVILMFLGVWFLAVDVKRGLIDGGSDVESSTDNG